MSTADKRTIAGKIGPMRLPLLMLIPALAANAADGTWAQVKAILDSRCISCHGETKQKAGLRLDSPEWLAKGGRDGAVLIPGKPEESKVYTLATLGADSEDKMPPKGERLTAEQLATLKSWIAAGAKVEAAPATGAPAAIPVKMPPREAVPAAPQVAKAALDDLAAQQIQVQALEGGWLDVNAAHTRNGITDEQLALLAKAGPAIAFLDLAGSGITDKQLRVLKSLPRLQRLHLERTPVSDAGVAAIAECSGLTYLNLTGTAVSDAGLPALRPLTGLRDVYLWQSKATPAGAEGLRKLLPEAQVVLGPDDLPSQKMEPGKKKRK